MLAETSVETSTSIETSVSDSTAPALPVIEPIFIGVTGGSASGKTLLCKVLRDRLIAEGVTCEILSADNWYFSNNVNFDCPQAYDWKEFYDCLVSIRDHRDATTPEYDYCTQKRTGRLIPVPKVRCYLIEGILVLWDAVLRQMFDLKIFVDAPDDTRLCRRIRRDILERERDLNSILMQHEKMVQPGYTNYIEPTKRNADIIVPNLGDSLNPISIDIVMAYVNNKLGVN